MAKLQTIQYYARYFNEDWSFTDINITASKSSKIVWQDAESGDCLIVQGQGLKLDNGMISSGTISAFSIVNDDRQHYIDYYNLSYKRNWFESDDIFELVSEMMERFANEKFKVIGTVLADELVLNLTDEAHIVQSGKGDDMLGGGGGKDRLTGGLGNDTFVFRIDDGKDVITDFDAVGGSGMQDHINLITGTAYEIRKSGKNTVIDLEDGSSLTLLDVKVSRVTDADFVFSSEV